MKTKILGIHGKGSDINGKSREVRKKLLKEKLIEIDLFQFPNIIDPTYKDWEKVFKQIDFGVYDTVYANSFGGIVTLRYLHENNISVNRIIMTSPGKSFNTINGKQPNINNIWKGVENIDFSNVAKEKIVISSRNDKIVPYNNGLYVSEISNADFILLNKGGHSLEGYFVLIMDLIKNGLQNNTSYNNY